MLYLAIIYHMHQPYYKNLLTGQTDAPWVRLHGIKDYLDMVQILKGYPKVHLTFNLVPSLLEQVQDYANANIKDKFLELSYKPALELNQEDKKFILQNFFSINKEKVISMHPRYYELYFKNEKRGDFTAQDFLDLQVWFNLAWTDPYFRQNIPELNNLVRKARFFTEEEKRSALGKQLDILKEIVPAYKQFAQDKQVELTLSPYYHPILPLLYNTRIAKEANTRSILPKVNFAYPEDAKAQIHEAVDFFKSRFSLGPCGMWPSEESVSEHVLPYMIEAGINWIVADEAILFKSCKMKKRDTKALYQPYILKRKDGDLNIVFRDRNLSDLIGFVYHQWKASDAVADLMKHLENISLAFKDEDILVTIALDGENAWEYYTNDGHDFLELLYRRLSEAEFLKTVTVSEYLKTHSAHREIKRLSAGSWIYANFNKWMGHPYKARAWEYLAEARNQLKEIMDNEDKRHTLSDKLDLAWKQIHIAEGSDWFWWYGEDPDGSFDRLFRMHLANFYTIIGKQPPDYLNQPLR